MKIKCAFFDATPCFANIIRPFDLYLKLLSAVARPSTA